jgi:acyl-coenzyme A thioesterase PaaI-like protein
MAESHYKSLLYAYKNIPSDAETLELFQPPNELAREIDEHIKNHHLAVQLRNDPNFEESRPHLKILSPFKEQNLMAGTLAGEGMIAVPPLHFAEEGGKSSVSIFYLGSDICGHPGIVHGGLLATILDEGLARCCFPALPKKRALTANLNVNYRKPAPADNYFVLKANTVKVQGRKAWVEGRIESLTVNGEAPTVYTEASALFIEPKDLAVRQSRIVGDHG